MSEILKLCQKLVSFPSIGQETAAAFAFLQKYLTERGFKVRILTYESKNGNKVQNLCATYGNKKPHLMFVGHLDVVPAGDIKQWQFNPFAGTIANDRLYGRGVADMKGAIACFIKACEDFMLENRPFDGKITLIISGDEEHPLVEGTKKVLECLQQEGEVFDFALVGEPSNPMTMGDEIKIGRRGDTVVFITSSGQQGHTAYASQDSNPVCNLINLLYAMQNDKLGGGSAYFNESSLQVTTFDVANQASNVVPSEAKATVDIRFTPAYCPQDIENWVQKHIRNTKGNFAVTFEHIGAAFVSNVNANVSMLQEIITQVTGKKPTFSTSGGTSDARFVHSYCPVVEYGLTNQSIHKVDESEKIANILLLYQIYKKFLERFFKLN